MYTHTYRHANTHIEALGRKIGSHLNFMVYQLSQIFLGVRRVIKGKQEKWNYIRIHINRKEKEKEHLQRLKLVTEN